MKNVVLVVAVHPDDETLGCGGTLFRHKHQGDEVHWLVCTSKLEKDGFSNEAVVEREKEIRAVADLYQFDGVHQLGFSTMKIDEYSMGELIGGISAVVQSVKPTVVYLPYKYDVHSDHRKIFEAAYSCTKVFRYPYIKKILMMEVLSETEFSPCVDGEGFSPNYFVDVSEYVEKKINVMSCYIGEVCEHPFPRSEKSIRALATLRGASAGCEYAEGFTLLKEVL